MNKKENKITRVIEPYLPEDDKVQETGSMKLYSTLTVSEHKPGRVLTMKKTTMLTWAMPEERPGRIKCKKHDFL